MKMFQSKNLLRKHVYNFALTKFSHQLTPILSTAPVNRFPHVQPTI